MKKNIIKIAAVIMFFLIWCAPISNDYLEGHHYLFIAGYLVGILALMFIKNKYLSFIVALIILMPVVILNQDYLLFLFSPFLITAEYIGVFKNRGKSIKQNKFYFGANISVFAGAAVLIYQYFASDRSAVEYAPLQFVIWAMFIVYFILALICLSKRISYKQMASKSSLSENEIKEIRFVYILNLFCYIETLLFYYFINTNTLQYVERIFFFPWFVYLGIIVWYKDPIFNCFVNKSEAVFEKLTEK